MRLPLFPLRIVAFPHLPLPISIFEERYQAMTEDVLRAGSPFAGRFVVSMIVDGREVGGEAEAHRVGTICEVRTAHRYTDGRWVLLCVGEARVRLGDVDTTGRYTTVDVEPIAEVAGDGAVALLPTVQAALDGYLATVKRFVAEAASIGHESQEIQSVAQSLDEVLKPIQLPDDPLAASYAVGGVLQIELARKQVLLELPDAASRLRAELALLRRESQLLSDGALPPVSTSDLGYHPN
jgi:Lon protease-like protein